MENRSTEKAKCVTVENTSTEKATTSKQGQYYSTYSVLQLFNFTYITVIHVNAQSYSLGPTLKLFLKFTCLFGCFVMSVSQRDPSMVAPSVDACADIST